MSIIVGFGIKSPGDFENTDEFWDMLVSKKCVINDIPENRILNASKKEPIPSKGGLYSNIDLFDNEYFGISPKIAKDMDPQQRMALETSMDAIQDSLIDLKILQSIRTGVFVGAGSLDYLTNTFKNGDLITPYTMQGGTIGNIANIVSFYLNLTGVSLTMDTACSSSMVALHMADSKIKNNELDAAIVIGSNLVLSMDGFIGFSKAKLLSPEGNSLPFHKDGNGFVRSDGCIATLIIKKELLSSHQLLNSYAEIFKSGSNENGRNTSLTTPSVNAQYNLLYNLLKDCSDHKVSFVEAHGTGTKVGDPIEFESITNVLRDLNYKCDNSIPISSVKSNIGHMETASGMAGVLKACLSIKHKLFPCGPHLSKSTDINSKISKLDSSLKVILEHEKIEDNEKNIYLVNSFGYGGANACVILKDSTPNNSNNISSKKSMSPYNLLCLTASTETKLDTIEQKYMSLMNNKNIDVLTTLQNNKTNMGQYKRTILLQKTEETVKVVNKNDNIVKDNTINDYNKKNNNIKTAFIFSGQGSQYSEMGKYLYNNYTVFENSVNEMDDIYKELSGKSLVNDFGLCKYMKEDDIANVIISTLIITIIQVATVDLLFSLGIYPDYSMGHSTGELSAMYTTGLTNRKELFKITYERAHCQLLMPEGAMIAVLFNENIFHSLKNEMDYKDEIFLSATNTIDSLTLSGTTRAVKEMNDLATKYRYKTVILKGINKAFHSPHTDICKNQFFELGQFGDFKLSNKEQLCQFVSSVDGNIKTKEELSSRDYWWKNINLKVDFLKATETLSNLVTNVIEISPNNILNKYITSNLPNVHYLNISKKQNECYSLLNTISYLYLYNNHVNVNIGSLQSLSSFDNYRVIKNTWKHDTSFKSLSWEKALSSKTNNHEIINTDFIVVPTNFETYELTKDHDIYLKDHIIDEQKILPGALFISKALTLINISNEILNDIKFIKKVTWDTTMKWDINNLSFFNNSCTMQKNKKETEYNDFIIESEMIESIAINKFYKYLDSVEIKFGKRFKLINKIEHTKDYKYIRGEINFINSNDCENIWPISPTIIDAGFQMCIFLTGIHEMIFIPYKIDKIITDILNYTISNIVIEATLINVIENKYVYDIKYLSNGKIFMRIYGFELFGYSKKKCIFDIYSETKVDDFKFQTNLTEYIILDLTKYNYEKEYEYVEVINKWNKLNNNIIFILSSENVGVLLGMIRTFRKEHNKLVKIIVNKSNTNLSYNEIHKVISSNETNEYDYEYNGKILINKFEKHIPNFIDTPYRIELARPGNLSSFKIKGVTINELKINEVLVEIKYVSLHFKDVMLAMNLLPGFNPVLGLESFGIVKNIYPGSKFKVGDRVICLDFSTKNKEVNSSLLASNIIYNENNLIKIDDDILCDESELAGYLGVMITAHYALKQIGNLSKDDTILIHSALGGVGQSAIQVAKSVGANIIVSAGSESRRNILHEKFNIDLSNIIDSRSPENFVSEINRITNNKGVDIILNSLSGASLIESVKCLAPCGRFIEIGKRDIMENSNLNLNLLKENISFMSVHLDLLANTSPDKIKKLCNECLSLLKDGIYKTIKTNVFDYTNIETAIREMSKGKHEGKNVIKMSSTVKTNEFSKHGLYNSKKAYLYTGSTEGVGFSNMINTIMHGSRNVYIISSSVDNMDMYMKKNWKNYLILKRMIQKYNDLKINFIKCDLSKHDLNIKSILDCIKEEYGGMFHFATSYNSQKNSEITIDNFNQGFDTKTSVKYFLEYFYKSQISIDFVFLCTSIVGLVGNDLQSVYCAANTFCYELSNKYSNLLNVPVFCVDLPLVVGSGYLSEFKNYNDYIYNKNKNFSVIHINQLCNKFNEIILILKYGSHTKTHYLIYEDTKINSLFNNNFTVNQDYNHLYKFKNLDFVDDEKLPTEERRPFTNTIEPINTRQISKIEKINPRTNNNLLENLIEKLSNILECSNNNLSKETIVSEVGLDSIGSMELSEWCKETYSIEVESSYFLSPKITILDIFNKLQS